MGTMIRGFFSRQKIKNQELEQREEDERRQLAQKQQELKKLSEDVVWFKRMMAHNIRMPMAIISGYGELLLDGEVSGREEELDCIQKICNNIEYLDTLTKVLLDDDSEDALDRKEYFDVLECVNRVAEYVKNIARKSGIGIAVNSSRSKVMFYGNRISFMRGFFNLVENSIRYMNREGTIVITVEETEKEIMIVYRDDGEGMKKEEAEHITEMDFQGSNKKKSGHGLGMFLLNQMVENHGGTLTVRTGQEKGMAIYMAFPRKRQENL